MPKNINPIAFGAKINKTETCWLWTGRIEHKGYGTFGQTGAHKISFELANGKVPKGLVLDHICRVRHCVNPDHLRIVTRGQNVLENSVSACAINKNKTHCSRGHDFKNHGYTYKSSRYPDKIHRGCYLCRNLIRRVPPAPRVPKTHCKRKHEFTEQNTNIINGSRQCRSCSTIRTRKHRLIKRLEKQK